MTLRDFTTTFNGLTNKEEAVCEALFSCYTVEDLAQEFNNSQATIASQLRSISKKINANSKTEIIARYALYKIELIYKNNNQLRESLYKLVKQYIDKSLPEGTGDELVLATLIKGIEKRDRIIKECYKQLKGLKNDDRN